MGARQGQVQEALWIEHGQCRRHEQILYDLQPCFGSACAVRVTAHTIKHKHQGSVFGYDDSGAILVIRTVTQRGDLGVFNLHNSFFGVKVSKLCRKSLH